MVLKRGKCFFFYIRTWRIIVQWDTLKIPAVFSHVKANSRKSSSTSGGNQPMSTWASILYRLKRGSCNSWWPWYTVSKVLEEQVIQKTPLLDRWTVLFYIIEGLEGGGGGGVLIPFSSKLFFSNPSSNPTIPAGVAQIEIPFPFFYCFFHESQSQCTKSHFPASKKGKSQLPFYPFTTLIIQFRRWLCSPNDLVILPFSLSDLYGLKPHLCGVHC